MLAQSMHDAEPGEEEKRPAEQLKHTPEAEVWPARQGSQTTAPGSAEP